MRASSEVLALLAPHAILVGSASRSDKFRDIDLVVSHRRLEMEKRLLPKPWESAFPMNIKSFQLDVPIEVFRVWYGPSYSELSRGDLVTLNVLGVPLRAWPINTRPHKSVNVSLTLRK